MIAAIILISSSLSPNSGSKRFSGTSSEAIISLNQYLVFLASLVLCHTQRLQPILDKYFIVVNIFYNVNLL